MNSPSLDILPAEILLRIIPQTIQTLPYFQKDKSALLALCLTNKRFLSLAQPLLYREIKIRFQISPSDTDFPIIVLCSNSLLQYRSFSTNETLRGYARKLDISIIDNSREKLASKLEHHGSVMLKQLISWFVDVQSLSVYDPLIILPWSLMVFVLQSMKRLEQLSLSLRGSIRCSALLRLIEPARLKKLYLYSSILSTQDYCIYDTEGLNYPLTSNFASKYLRTLSLKGSQTTKSYLKEFIPLCENLQSFILSQFGVESNQTLHDLLSPMMCTLKRLVIDSPRRFSSDRMKLAHIQLSGFLSLTDLTIREWIVDQEDEPAEIQQALLVSSLHRIEWEYSRWTVNQARLVGQAFRQTTCFNLKNVTLNMRFQRDYERTKLVQIVPEMQLIIADLSSRGITAEFITPRSYSS